MTASVRTRFGGRAAVRCLAVPLGLLITTACGSTVQQTGIAGGGAGAGEGLELPGSGATTGSAALPDPTATSVVPSIGGPGSSLGGQDSLGTTDQPGQQGTATSRALAPLKIGFVGVGNLSALASFTGGANFGDTTKQIHALVDYVNGHGGLGGHKVLPIIRNADAMSAGSSGESICAGFTQDDHVFAVMALTAGVDASIPSCYARAKTIVVNSLWASPLDQEAYDAVAPYYWSTSGVNATSMARLTARALAQRGFYAGGKLGVLYNDNAIFRRAYEKTLKPELAALGVEITADFAVAPYDGVDHLGDISSDVSAAVLKFAAAGVDRVVFIESLGGISAFFIPQAESQGYQPTYGLTSANWPNIVTAQASPTSMAKSVTAGWTALGDSYDTEVPFPAPGAERHCMKIMSSAGQSFANRADAQLALEYCDLVFFFKTVADKTGSDLSSRRWISTAMGLGEGFSAAITPTTSFGPAKRDGASQFRYMTYDAACKCLKYQAGSHPIPR